MTAKRALFNYFNFYDIGVRYDLFPVLLAYKRLSNAKMKKKT